MVCVISHAGGTLLTATVRASAPDRALSAALSPWSRPAAVHDPAPDGHIMINASRAKEASPGRRYAGAVRLSMAGMTMYH
jgi:hypothetical protein